MLMNLLLIKKLYKDLGGAERLSQSRHNSMNNLVGMHSHFDVLYPTSGTGAHQANESIRLFSKAMVRLESSGSLTLNIWTVPIY